MFKKILVGIVIFSIGFIGAWTFKSKHDFVIEYVSPFSMSVVANYVTVTGSIKALNYQPGYAVNSSKITCKVEEGICKMDIVGLMGGFLNMVTLEYEIVSIKNNVIYAENQSSLCVNEFLEIDINQNTILMKAIKKSDIHMCKSAQGTKLSEISEYYPSIKAWKSAEPHI
jgi:hypothetical protein